PRIAGARGPRWVGSGRSPGDIILYASDGVKQPVGSLRDRGRKGKSPVRPVPHNPASRHARPFRPPPPFAAKGSAGRPSPAAISQTKLAGRGSGRSRGRAPGEG